MSLAALRDPGYRPYFLGNLLALQAIWIQRVGVSWLAWDLTGSPGFTGVVAGLGMIPSFVTGPFFGVLVDRTDIKRAAWATTGGMIAGLLVVVLLLAVGWLGPLALAAAALGIGVVTSAHHPVRMSLGPRLVPAAAVSSVIALGSVNFNVARLIAPVIAGLLISTLGVAATLAIALAFHLPMLLILPRLAPRDLPPRERAETVWQAFRKGVSHAARDPVVRACILLMGVFTVAGRGLLEILPVLADGVFARGAAGLGLLTGAAGAGALCAAVGLALLPARSWGDGRGIPAPVVAGLALGQLGVAGLGWIDSWPLALACVGALGFVSTLGGVSLQTVVQVGLTDNMRGRIMSLWIMTGFGMAAVGATAIGWAIEALGARAALTGFGLAGFAAIAALSLPHLRRAR